MFLLNPLNETCRKCGENTVAYGLKEEPSTYKIYVECTNDDCRHDHGKAGIIKRSNISHEDEAYELAEEKARKHIQ